MGRLHAVKKGKNFLQVLSINSFNSFLLSLSLSLSVLPPHSLSLSLSFSLCQNIFFREFFDCDTVRVKERLVKHFCCYDDAEKSGKRYISLAVIEDSTIGKMSVFVRFKQQRNSITSTSTHFRIDVFSNAADHHLGIASGKGGKGGSRPSPWPVKVK
jgi:hypothetical protein